jgi:predicted aspartyl protease
MTYRDELRAALDRAEAAERRLEAVCAVHPQAPVAAACALCEKHLCTACVMMSIAGTFCGACFVKERQRELRRRLLVVTAGVGAIVASVLGAIWFWRPAPPVIMPPAMVAPAPSPEQRRAAYRVVLAERLAKDACNQPLALELAEANNNAGEFAATLQLIGEFQSRCGSFTRLLWAAYVAHQSRGEQDDAALVASELIVTQPHDADYWWWRGDALAAGDRKLEASVDYRQAIALGAHRIAPWQLSEIAEGLGIPCEGANALGWAFDEDASPGRDQTETRRRQLWRSGDCDLTAGKGAVALELVKPDSDELRTRVVVGAKSGRFLLDLQAGLTVLDAHFAERAGIRMASDVPVWVYATGRVLPGRTGVAARIDVGGASAKEVDVLVSSDLPTGYDGVIGLSFLWRFALVTGDDGALGLAER